ncbi:MAG: cytochrome c [Acidimicrobiia bacterium]
MTRAPASRAAPGGGLLSGPNLPYSLTTLVALGVLVAFILMADPFRSGAVSTGFGPGDPVVGDTTFNSRCSVCHGPGGEGIIGLGKPLTTSEFAAGLTDEELLAFLIEGRASDDPDNTTGIVMPGRAGVPPLSDEELVDVIAYLRTLSAG